MLTKYSTMASSALTLVVRPRGMYILVNWSIFRLIPCPGRPIKGLPETISVPSDASTSQIFQEIANASKFSIHRLRVTKGSDGTPIASTRDVTVHQTGLRNKSAIDVKDLGTFTATNTLPI